MKQFRQSKHTLAPSNIYVITCLFSLALLSVITHADENFYAVGDPDGQNLYFSLIGETDKPVGHDAKLTVVKPGTEIVCNTFTLTPATGKASEMNGEVRLPGTGSINAKPTSEFDQADQAKFLLTFDRDRLPEKVPAKWITVDTFTAVGIKTQTVASAAGNTDNTRKKIGIGEKVDIFIKPGELQMTPGEIDLNFWENIMGDNDKWTLEAGSEAGEATIIFEKNDFKLETKFNIVHPSGLKTTVLKNYKQHLKDMASAGMVMSCEVQPIDVSFAYLAAKEVDSYMTKTSGHYAIEGIVYRRHRAGEDWAFVDINNKLPDYVYSGTIFGNSYNKLNEPEIGHYLASGFTYITPWQFIKSANIATDDEVGTGVLFSINSVTIIEGGTGRTTQSKGDASVTFNVDDETVIFPPSEDVKKHFNYLNNY